MTINAVDRSISVLPSADGVRYSRDPGGSGGAGGGTIIASADFEDGLLPTSGTWYSGDQSLGTLSVSSDTAANYAGSVGSAKGEIAAGTDGVHLWLGYDVSAIDLSDGVYVEFYAKMPSANKRGLKFLKMLGQVSSGYANVTFGIDYTSGRISAVSFGDGSTSTNDTAQVIRLDGSNPSFIGRSYGTASVLTPQNSFWDASNWGTSWHHFRMYWKFNSGTTALNEVADGEAYLEIDDLVYVNATGLFNRHYSNLPLDKIEFFGYSGDNEAFEIWYDDIVISTGGFT